MNPLQTLIADELIEQNIKRSELCKRVVYQNVSKCLRKDFRYHRFQGVDVVLDNNLSIVKRK